MLLLLCSILSTAARFEIVTTFGHQHLQTKQGMLILMCVGAIVKHGHGRGIHTQQYDNFLKIGHGYAVHGENLYIKIIMHTYES